MADPSPPPSSHGVRRSPTHGPEAADKLWGEVKKHVRSRVAATSYATWIESCRPVDLTDDAIFIQARTSFHLEWLERSFFSLLVDAITAVLGRPLRVEASVAAGLSLTPPLSASSERYPEDQEPPIEASTDPSSVDRRPVGGEGGRPTAASSDLNDYYVFDRFVAGPNARLAKAAAIAVAERPGRSYNPLFVYGGVGLGKTHLMHAIGNRFIMESDGRRPVLYLRCVDFVNEVIGGIRRGTMPELRKRLLKSFVLLIDDIHFLAGKERTQEEFFHTFNDLYDSNRQIVITSDRPPQELDGLEERLVSRFVMGLVADVKPPEFETRVAILRMKADEDGVPLGEDVINFIAERCTSSVRHLQGAYHKLMACSITEKKDISLDMARSNLSSTVFQGNPAGKAIAPASPERLARAVCAQYGIGLDMVTSSSRKRNVVEARQVAMYLIKQHTSESLVSIGKFFGNRNHSTVLHSIRKIDKMAEADVVFRGSLQRLSTVIDGVIHT